MAGELDQAEETSRLGRLLGDPVRLRNWGRRAAVVLVVLAALASDGLGGLIPRLVFPITWLLLPVVAAGIGWGDAFFIRYGRGVRLELVMLIGGTLVALGSCVLLSTVSGDSEGVAGRVVDMVLYGLLYGGLLALVAALIGFGAGRGLDYMGQRIESLSEEDW